MSSRAATRYANAVLQNAQKTNTEAVVFGDMQSVYNTIKGSRELQMLLHSPIIKAEDKKKALMKIFSGQSETTQSLIGVLIKNKRLAILSNVSKSYIDLYNEVNSVKDATVITAVPLTDELENKIISKIKELTGSEAVTLKNEIDPNILGGFILRVGDIQYDASIINQFRNLREEFKNQYN